MMIYTKKTAHPGKGKAFTMIEILVTVSVIGVLIGLLVPAVQSAREAARRVQCVANLKQLGVALHSYYSVHNMFPPSQLFTTKKFSVNFMSEHVFILPYIEETNLYNNANLGFANSESPGYPSTDNHTVRHTKIATFLCPSEPSNQCLNSYRFNRGCFGMWSSGLNYDGPFSIGVTPTQAAIVDGLTNTAFVSERIAGSWTPNDTSNSNKDMKLYTSSIGIMSDKQIIPICLQDSPGEWDTTAGRWWFYSGFANTKYNHSGTPNDKRPTCFVSTMADSGPGGLSPPRSYHVGSVNVLFGDGRVQTVTDTINQRIWSAYGTFNAGDSVSE